MTTGATSERSDMAKRAVRLDELARALREAASTYDAVVMRNGGADLSLEEAYRVQSLQLGEHLAAGETLAGWKVGAASGAGLAKIEARRLCYGFVLSRMVHKEGSAIAATNFIVPKVEPGLAFVLKSELKGTDVTLEQAREAIGAVYPAVEITDSRIENCAVSMIDAVADNVCCGAIVLGELPLNVSPENLHSLACTLVIDGHAAESGTGLVGFGDPVAPLAWLANALTARGAFLRAGQMVVPGSFTKALPVLADSTAAADFGQLGSVAVSFT